MDATDVDVPLSRRNSRATLDRLLARMFEAPDREAELVQEVHAIFGETRAILILDMSGFTRSTQQHGIVPFLLRIMQMRRICAPAIEEAGGILVKEEADNLYALFDDAAPAALAARAIMDRLDAINSLLDEDRQLYAAIGIGYGDLLNIDDADIFGDEMNLACKLGEDIAGRGDILLTDAARARPGLDTAATRPATVSVSGLSLTYHTLIR